MCLSCLSAGRRTLCAAFEAEEEGEQEASREQKRQKCNFPAGHQSNLHACQLVAPVFGRQSCIFARSAAAKMLLSCGPNVAKMQPEC